MALIATASTAAIAADEAYFDDRWYFAPMGSYVLAEDERSTDDGIGAALALGKRLTPRLELELRGQYLQYDAEDNRQVVLGVPVGPAPEDVEITAGGVGASYFFMPSGRGLFAHADALFGDASLYNLGLGFDVGENVALRFEALYHIDDDAGVEEPQFNLGFRIPFGERRQPPPEPEPVRTVAPIATPPPPKPECEVPGPGQQVDLNGCAVGDVIVLHGVNFDFDKATLTAEAKQILDDVADALRQRPDITLEIAGHTDGIGTDAYNQALSEARAESVRQYLIGRGIDASRMHTIGHGESMPVASNDTEESRAQNRRVQFLIIESEPVAAPPPVPAAAPAPTPMPTPTPPEPAPEPEPEPVPAPQVSIVGMAFTPATLTVPTGTRVVWTNDDRRDHTVRFADEESRRIPPGETYSRTFEAPGEYPYDCGLHPSMRGVIVVQ